MDLADCEAFYREEVWREMQADDQDPTEETPSYAWLNSNYPGFVKHLSRNFDLSPGDFYEAIGVPADPEDDHPFAHVDEDSRDAIESYLTELLERRGRAESTVDARRSILRTVTRTYVDVNQRRDLLSPLYDPGERGAEMDRMAATFDVLDRFDDALTTLASRRKYVQETRRFYRHLVTFGNAQFNPVANLEERFGWDRAPEWDNQALAAADVRALYETADDPVDRMLVVGCCGWGLRPSEVTSLHVRQLRLDPDDDEVPYVEFDEGERKNGPGTVALLTGVEDLEERIATLSEREDWTGYVLPSKRADSGHLSTETARRRFRGLAERADVTVDGDYPTPKMGRRYWYSAYGDAVQRVAERFESIAAEQGSADASIVLDNYLSDAEARKHRREEMREDLEDLFSR